MNTCLAPTARSGAAHGGNRGLVHRAPVREVALLRHLERAEDADIDVAAPDHGERVGVMKERRSVSQLDGLLARVDVVRVGFGPGGNRAHPQHTVLAMKNDVLAGGQVVRHEHGPADSEIHVGAIVDILHDALCDLVRGSRCVSRFHQFILEASTTRFT